MSPHTNGHPASDTPSSRPPHSGTHSQRAGNDVRRRANKEAHKEAHTTPFPPAEETMSSPKHQREGEEKGFHLPPKPRRRLIQHFSLRYTLLSLFAMGVVVVLTTWIVVETPRWLAQEDIAKTLDPQAQQIVEELNGPTLAQSAGTSTQELGRATSTVVRATSSAPEASHQPRVRVKETETGWLNVREGPSTSYRRIRRVLPGEVYPFTEVRDGWYRIELEEGVYGWVSGTYVEEVEE